MDAGSSTRDALLPPSLSRLTVFTAASIALHALTLVAYGPAGVMSALYSGPAANSVLHATLMPVEKGLLAQSIEPAARPAVPEHDQTPPPGDETRESASSSPDVLATASPRAGTPGGLDLPFPEKWFTAEELDVRAEPLTAVQLVYPPELNGSGAAGRVRVLLFVDERGVVRKSHITAAEPEGLFDDAALKTWDTVRFAPAMKDGVAVKSQKLLEVDFQPY